MRVEVVTRPERGTMKKKILTTESGAPVAEDVGPSPISAARTRTLVKG
jgi:hypothetical protein